MVVKAFRGFRFTRFAAVLAVVLFTALPVFAQDKKSPIKVEDVTITAPDGIKLATYVARPDREGKFPTIIIRSPYGSDWKQSLFDQYVPKGYACVFQDVRGRHSSGGIFDPFVNEIPDGDATLRWIRAQPWSNGVVGSSGFSYIGFTSLYLSAGKEAPPAAIVAGDPVASPATAFTPAAR